MSQGLSSTNVWLSYDSVAELYERVAVPWFEPMARDLIRAVGLSRGASVLDVGTGTGLTAGLARSGVGPGGLTVGIDPSAGMLKIAKARRGLVTAAAAVPGLPFGDAFFDAVVANLVISHLPDLSGGLADMVRVLRPQGRLGVTAWAPVPGDVDSQDSEADEIVASVRDQFGLPSAAPVQGAPREEELRDARRLTSYLASAGLLHVDARARTYRHVFTLDEYLSGWGGFGRYLRWQAGERRWQDFTDRAAATLRQRFGPSILSVKRVSVATGSAP